MSKFRTFKKFTPLKKAASTSAPHARRPAMLAGYLFSSYPMRCPLCGTHVPAKTVHECQKEIA